MPVTINGDGSITGLSVGGLPDGCVDTDTLANNAVTSTKLTGKTFVSYALLADRHGATAGDRGDFTAGDWRTRSLNNEVVDTDNIVSLSSNQFTLQAGTYQIKFRACAYSCNRHVSRLREISPTAQTIASGSGEYALSSSSELSWSDGWCRTTITQATTYEIQHQCQTTKTGNGIGFQMNFSGADYVQVEIYKEAT